MSGSRAPRLEASDGLVVLRLGRGYRVASTLPAPRVAEAIAFLEAPRDIALRDYGLFARVAAEELRLGDAVVFLTAARLPESFHLEVVEARGVELLVAMTVGLEPLAYPRMGLYEPLCGTINIAVVVEEPGLRDNAALDLLATLASAKTAAMHLTRPVRGDSLTLGTVTDAVAVLYRDGCVAHAGPATTVGGLAADAVVEAIVDEWRRITTGSILDELVGGLVGVVRAYARRHRVDLGLLASRLCEVLECKAAGRDSKNVDRAELRE